MITFKCNVCQWKHIFESKPKPKLFSCTFTILAKLFPRRFFHLRSIAWEILTLYSIVVKLSNFSQMGRVFWNLLLTDDHAVLSQAVAGLGRRCSPLLPVCWNFMLLKYYFKIYCNCKNAWFFETRWTAPGTCTGYKINGKRTAVS